MNYLRKILPKLTVLSILILIIAGCSSISVNTDYDPNFDFTKLEKFGFVPLTADAGIDQLSAKKLGEAITANLEAKSFILSEDADFGVALLFSTSTKTSIQSYGYGYGYGRWGGGMGSVDVSQYDEGTLVIDIIDIVHQELVWRGQGTGILDSSPDMAARTENINYAVTQILANFPPAKNVNNK